MKIALEEWWTSSAVAHDRRDAAAQGLYVDENNDAYYNFDEIEPYNTSGPSGLQDELLPLQDSTEDHGGLPCQNYGLPRRWDRSQWP
jgi:hypothetical protein